MELKRVFWAKMEPNPHRQQRSKKRASTSSSSSRDVERFTRAPEAAGECSVDCSGKSCRSCSAALLADCVALCCCPLAVLSLLGLAFIKVPCAMGRRCFLGRRKRKICVRKEEEVRGKSRDLVLEFGEKEGVCCEGEIVEQRSSLCGGFVEADNVLLEMYQVGHLGFGRVSYTGIQPNDK